MEVFLVPPLIHLGNTKMLRTDFICMITEPSVIKHRLSYGAAAYQLGNTSFRMITEVKQR